MIEFKQCMRCMYYAMDGECDAFPEGIPGAIRTGEHDHRDPHPGDNGVRFKPLKMQRRS